MITLDKIKKLLILERIATVLMAGTITLAWDANVEPDLAGYKIHYGESSGNYTTIVDVKNVTEVKLDGFTNGKTYYFVATAYDENKNESTYSNEISHTFSLTKSDVKTPQGYTKK
jgi:hypothetical protein